MAHAKTVDDVAKGPVLRIYSVSRNRSLRGEGLGNELIPAAKSYLCAKALGAVQISHSWGLNRRGYRHLFGTTVFDTIPPCIAEGLLPRREIRRDDWLAERVEDYGQLCVRVLEKRPFPTWAPAGTLVHADMWGGYALIDPARSWIRSVLLSARGAADRMKVFERDTSAAPFRIGVHVRRGDFSAMQGSIKGKYNIAIPIDWYGCVLSNILPVLPKNSMVCVFSDAPMELQKLLPANAQGTPLWQPSFPGHDTADMLALASCDLIVCSVSAYSIMAAWLARKPYVWLRDQMQEQAGRFSIWGKEGLEGNWLQAEALQAASSALPSPCVPATLDGSLNVKHLERIMADGFSHERQYDPLRYGCTA